MFEPKDPDFRARVRQSFARQAVMERFGARLSRVDPGEIEILLPWQQDLTQQHGFIHAGIVATILDSACGYAAFSLMPSNAGVLSVEYKVNLLAPAKGDEVIARASVVRPGRQITVTRGDAYAREDDREKLVATMQATIMAVFDRLDVEG